jgi:RHS repeat-associated protein
MAMKKSYYSVNGELLGEKTAGGQRVDYLTDALGSVTATVDQTGTVLNRYVYKPYGSLLVKTGVAADPAFTWVGSQGYRQTAKKYSDVYIRARHGDTLNGRWTSKDPIGFGGEDWNLFRMVRSRPVDRTDPTGKVINYCSGTCGGAVDGRHGLGWIEGEIHWQLTTIDANITYRRKVNKPWDLDHYIFWANEQQRYKDENYFKFSAPPIDSMCAKGACGHSVTMCGSCVRSATLGNIMYGFVGCYLAFTIKQLTDRANEIKRAWHQTVDPYDADGYAFGCHLYGLLQNDVKGSHVIVTPHAFCNAFKAALAKFPTALRESTKDGNSNDLSHCTLCRYQTFETRHGSSNPFEDRPRW